MSDLKDKCLALLASDENNFCHGNLRLSHKPDRIFHKGREIFYIPPHIGTMQCDKCDEISLTVDEEIFLEDYFNSLSETIVDCDA